MTWTSTSTTPTSEHFEGYRDPDGELAEIVAGTLPVPASGRRMFLSMGIAMDDVALGALCYDRAVKRGVGRVIEFPWLHRSSFRSVLGVMVQDPPRIRTSFPSPVRP